MACKGLHFGWVVLAATFYINLIVDGYCFVFGIIMMYIQEDYPTYATWMISIIGGLVPTLYLIFAPICIAINEFLGPTRVIIVASIISAVAFILAWLNFFFQAGFYFDLFMLGIFQGISSALLYGPSIAVIPEYFPPNQRSLAAGITTCGSPVGAIFYSLIIPPLFDAFGWRGSLAVFAGFNLNGCICAMAFLQSLKPDPRKLVAMQTESIPLEERPKSALSGGEKKDEEIKPLTSPSAPDEVEIQPAAPQKLSFVQVIKKYFDPSLVCQPTFIALLFAAAFSIVGYYIPTLLVTAQSKNPAFGVSQVVQTNLVLMWGIFNTVGRAVSGRLGDYYLKNPFCTSFWIFIIGHAVSAVILLVFPNVMFLGDISFVAFVLFYGFFIAPLVTMRSVIVSDMFGVENANASFGWFLCIQGVVQILGFILPTWLDTLSAMYAYGFGAACFFLSCACVGITFRPFFEVRRRLIAKDNAKKKSANVDA